MNCAFGTPIAEEVEHINIKARIVRKYWHEGVLSQVVVAICSKKNSGTEQSDRDNSKPLPTDATTSRLVNIKLAHPGPPISSKANGWSSSPAVCLQNVSLVQGRPTSDKSVYPRKIGYQEGRKEIWMPGSLAGNSKMHTNNHYFLYLLRYGFCNRIMFFSTY